ncbi:PaaI family thioesterase [Haloferax sp. S1W]|uniref:PaaI family thioesterase n=1 Tax=Haloferax sp. S1W TaxID=3377110 RepID=UPI0037CA8A73
MPSETTTVTLELAQETYDRLTDVTDSPEALIRESTKRRIELEEAIAFTRDGGFQGPEGFRKMLDDELPTWPLGSLLGIELRSMGEGESRWVLDAGPEHANPMGTIHGGVLCDIGDAALSTAYMSTVEPGASFTTVDLTVNYLRPVWSGQLEAIGRVVHKGRTIGLAECEITDEDGNLVAQLSGTCMTLQGESANRVTPGESEDGE